MSEPEREDRADRFAYRLMMGSFVLSAVIGVVVLGFLFFVVPLLFLSTTYAVLLGFGLSLVTILGIQFGWFTKRRYRPPDGEEPEPPTT